MKDCSVILANLTTDEYRRFEAARISYSGSTGMGARPENYHGLAPYIATYLSELPKALNAIGWENIKVKFAGEQMQVWRHDEGKTANMRDIFHLLNITQLLLEMAVQLERRVCEVA
jgi:hypothetical protein